jgi:hypothetical protein
MNEQKILAALMQSREAWQKIRPHVDKQDFSSMAMLVYDEVGTYYERDMEAQFVDYECILDRLCNKHASHAEKFETFMRNLPEVSTANILDDWCDVKMRALAQQMGALMVKGDLEKADELLPAYNDLKTRGLQADEQEFMDKMVVYQDAHADDFTSTLEKGARIPIAPAIVNDVIGGGLIVGSHTLVYAPPECGKTAFGVNTAYSIARNGRKVLYLGNEESAEMYLNRFLCRFCMKDLSWVLANKNAATELARTRGWANLVFIYVAGGNIPDVQAKILEHMPQVTIIDQLQNLQLGGRGKEPEKTVLLEKLAYRMRMFYSAHKIAGISISQASEAAIGERFLTIKDVYYSNIAVQGSCDLMIGIGMDAQLATQNRRMFCFTKNKLGGEHPEIQVELVHQISQFKGVG